MNASRRAFSLIELMVTLLIVLIVVSIATVMFLRTERAGGVEARKSELLQAAGSLSTFQQSHGYFPTDRSELTQLEPNMNWTTGIADTQGEISVSSRVVGDNTVLGLAIRSEGGMCVTMTVPPFGADLLAVRDSFEVGVGVDDDSVSRGTCSGSEALNREPGSVNQW